MAVVPDDVPAPVLEKSAAVPPRVAVLVGLSRPHGRGAFLERDADFSGGQFFNDRFSRVKAALESAGGGIEDLGISSHPEFPAGTAPSQGAVLHRIQGAVRNGRLHSVSFNFRYQEFPHGRVHVVKAQAVQGNVFRVLHADENGFSLQQDVGGSRLALQAYVFGLHQADGHGLGLVGSVIGVGNLRLSGDQGAVLENVPAGHEPDSDRSLSGAFPHERQRGRMLSGLDDERVPARHDEAVGRGHALPGRGGGSSGVAVVSLVRVYVPGMVPGGLCALRPFRVVRCRAQPG